MTWAIVVALALAHSLYCVAVGLLVFVGVAALLTVVAGAGLLIEFTAERWPGFWVGLLLTVFAWMLGNIVLYFIH